MHACMYQELLKTTTNSSCVCAHLANKADSDSDSELELRRIISLQIKERKKNIYCLYFIIKLTEGWDFVVTKHKAVIIGWLVCYK